MYPTDGGSYCVNDKEIILGEFDTQISEKAIEYEVSYGSAVIRYKSYFVYEGEVISFCNTNLISLLKNASRWNLQSICLVTKNN